MDDKIDILQENYDDSLFALLMSGLVREVGAYYIEENIRLQQDLEAAMSPAAERRILDAIDRAAARRRREERGRRTLRIVNRVGAAAAAAVLLFTTAFAASEDFRVGVTNLVYRVTDQVASWSFVQENDIPVPDFVEVPPEGLDVDIQWLPEGFFTVRDQYPESFIHEIRFENDEAESVTFVMQQLDLAGVANFDVENADRVEDVIISDALGMIVEKNGKNRVYWMDTDRQLFYEIYSETVDSETLVHIAENIILLD